MTAVPVVSATLTTRTYKEFGADFPHDTERLTADPVFVVVDAAPDLTCRECAGLGDCEGCDLPGPGIHPPWRCPSCGGSGVSPVYAARWRYRVVSRDDATEWVSTNCAAPAHRWHERRQIVEWRATDVTVLPVVDQDDPIACLDFGDDRTHLLVVIGDDDLWDVTDEPWAADLEVGQFVLRLSGWEHLQQPHTKMVEYDGDTMYPETIERMVPLSVPDGVLSWIELA